MLFYRLYSAGAQPQVQKLYRPISYPVGRGTRMLNSLVKWDHSTKWFLAKFGAESKMKPYFKSDFFLTKVSFAQASPVKPSSTSTWRSPRMRT